MKSLDDVIAYLQRRPECRFAPAKRLPMIPPFLRLPDDLAEFYSRFSEARLFGDYSDPRCHILPPDEVVQIGIAAAAEETTIVVQKSWYALAHVQDGNYFAIDLLPARLGEDEV